MTENPMLTDVEAARYIGMSVAFLRLSRCEGTYGNRTPGPPYYKIGRSVRYKLEDLDAWLQKHRVKEIDGVKQGGRTP